MEQLELQSGSEGWWKNKCRLGGGTCAYRCQYIHSDGRRCRKIIELQDPGRRRKYSHCAEWVAAAGWGRYQESTNPLHFCWRHRISGPFQSKVGAGAES
jgi:hypothetical protein